MSKIVRASLAALLLVVVASACEPTPTPTTTTTTTTSPPVVTNARPVQISVSSTHGCAVYHDGTVRCWGNNRDGQLGNGTTAAATAYVNAVKVSGINDAKEVTVGAYATCARRATGQVRCWGKGSRGVLGNGTLGSTSVPVAVTGITTATSVSMTTGTSPAACASLTGGTVKCWGNNYRGALGTDDVASSTSVQATTPVAVEGVTDATAVSAGRNHVCAVRANGGAACWGDNQSGQLGNASVPNPTAGGTTASSMSVLPVQVTGLSGATSVDAGNGHSCARTTAGDRCWGSNWTGQLGVSPAVQVQLTPVQPSGGRTFSTVSAGAATCGLDGTTGWCWGPDNSTRTGQIGNPNVPPPAESGMLKAPYTSVPMQVTVVTQAITVLANGDEVTCAGLADRSVRCWGSTLNGASLGAPAPL